MHQHIVALTNRVLVFLPILKCLNSMINRFYAIVFHMEINKNPLGFENINKLILKFSIPAITGMLINALYNVVDRIYIGNHPDLGINGLGGITIGFPMMLLVLAMGVLFGVGGATLFSMRLGEGNPKESQKVLSTALILLVFFSILYMIVGQIFLEPILRLFGASDEILPFAMEYMRVIIFGATFQVISIGMNNFVRADGSPKIAMLSMLLGAGTNILLDPLFIFVFNWGMFGAAFATILAQLFSATWIILYFRGKKARIRLEKLYFDFHLSQRIVSLGFPVFSLQLASSLLVSILNRTLTFYGGDVAIASMGIVNSIQAFMIMPIIGLNQGVQPIISFNYGAKNYDRVKTAIRYALFYATGISVFGYLLTRLFPDQLVSIFSRDASLMALTRYALYAWFFAIPFVGAQILASNFFQAIGHSRTALFLTLTRQVLVLIPCVLILPMIWGLNGLLFAAPISDTVSFCVTGFFFIRTYRHLDSLKSSEHPLNLSEEV